MDRHGNAAQIALQAAFKKNKIYYDSRKKTIEFEVGDEVFISQKALLTPGSVHNKDLANIFQTKFCGPFKISEKQSSVNYRLELLISFKRDNLFHISQLRKKKSIPDALFTAPVKHSTFHRYADDSEGMEVKEILGHKKAAKGYLMEVLFVDNSTEWIRRSELKRSAKRLLEDYELKHFSKQ